jgi:NAD(P)-dependent dehydrogenase (short-subunit alcohol dehydrogenase family)
MKDQKKSNYKNPASSTFEGIQAAFAKQVKVGEIKDSERLEGKTVMVDGASSGLGFAIASQLAKRGARVIMACRSGIPGKGEEVKRRTGNPNIEMVHVDFSDYHSILKLIKTVKEKYAPLDIVVSNSAMVPAKSRKTPQGLEEMFMVNYLSKFILINGLLEAGCFRKDGKAKPRIIFVASESHRHPPQFEWDTFGAFHDYGMNKTTEFYGYYKLLLTTFSRELARRLQANGNKEISVFALCPGPVNSNIAREAPKVFQPLMKLVFAMFFKSPAKASEPVVYLAISKDIEGKSYDYLFKWARKPIDEKADDEGNGKRLWELSENIVKSLASRP